MTTFNVYPPNWVLAFFQGGHVRTGEPVGTHPGRSLSPCGRDRGRAPCFLLASTLPLQPFVPTEWNFGSITLGRPSSLESCYEPRRLLCLRCAGLLVYGLHCACSWIRGARAHPDAKANPGPIPFACGIEYEADEELIRLAYSACNHPSYRSSPTYERVDVSLCRVARDKARPLTA
jgi:hypothetical protein